MSKPSVYEQVARFTHEYFGADATHYVARLIEIHTRKQPEMLSKAELMSLLDWIKSAVSFFTEDKRAADAYIVALYNLAEDSNAASSAKTSGCLHRSSATHLS